MGAGKGLAHLSNRGSLPERLCERWWATKEVLSSEALKSLEFSKARWSTPENNMGNQRKTQQEKNKILEKTVIVKQSKTKIN